MILYFTTKNHKMNVWINIFFYKFIKKTKYISINPKKFNF